MGGARRAGQQIGGCGKRKLFGLVASEGAGVARSGAAKWWKYKSTIFALMVALAEVK